MNTLLSLTTLRRGAAPALALAVFATALLLAGCAQPTPEERFELALDKIQNQRPPDYLGAKIILTELVKEPEADDELKLNSYVLLSEIYTSIGDNDQAAKYLGEGVAAFTLDTEEGQTLGERQVAVLAGAERFEEALELSRDILEREDIPIPRRTRMRLRQASLLAQVGEVEESRERFSELAIEFDDQQVQTLALESLVQSYLPDHPTSAALAYLEFAEAKPESRLTPLARFGAGQMYQRAGEEEKAEPLLEEFFESEKEAIDEILNPEEKIARQVALARAYQLTGKFEEERAIYESIADEYAEEERYGAGALRQLAISYLNRAEFDAALEALDRIQDLYPGTPSAEDAARMASNVSAARIEFEAQKQRLEDAERALDEAAQAKAAEDETGAETEAPEAAEPEAEMAEEPAPEAQAAEPATP